MSRINDAMALSPEKKIRHVYYEVWMLLDTARSDGEVQVLSAALKYIGEHNDPILARIYCTGREPRLLVLNAFDFAFWMGIFSAHPLPEVAT